MKTTLLLISNRIGWIIATIFLGAWLSAELVLAHWGDNRLPIQRTIHNYTYPAEILFMGNSRVTTGIKPSVISQVSTKSLGHPVQSYNLGMPSTPFGIHYLMFKHLVEQGKQPKVLIYGFVDNELTTTNFFDDANLAQISEIADLNLLFTKSIITLDNRSDLVIKKVSRVYRYRFIVREVLSRYLTQTQFNSVQFNFNQKGFQEFHGVVREEAIEKLIISEKSRYYKQLYSNSKNWSFYPSRTYLENFIKLALKSNIKLIFVELPVTELHNKSAQKSAYRKAYFERLKVYLKSYDIPLYSLRDVEPDSHIPDTIHLSDAGATSFTQTLFHKVIQTNLSKTLPSF